MVAVAAAVVVVITGTRTACGECRHVSGAARCCVLRPHAFRDPSSTNADVKLARNGTIFTTIASYDDTNNSSTLTTILSSSDYVSLVANGNVGLHDNISITVSAVEVT